MTDDPVRDRDGREVGVYPTVRAMKADAYRPVPDPLVPEVHFPDGVRLSRSWAVAVVGDGEVDGFLTARGRSAGRGSPLR